VEDQVLSPNKTRSKIIVCNCR